MNRRVLVTGGAGFIGSHVVDALLERGDEPHVVDDLSKGQVSNLPGAVALYVLDMTSSPLDRLFATTFAAVVHCAAQTNPVRSTGDPALDRRINVDGLRRVLEGASTSGASRFVFVSSGGAIYGETPTAATEETPPRPQNPYGRHKLEGERIVAAAPVAGISLRLSNVYGPRQRADAEGGVVSIFADRIAAGLPIGIFGDGAQERDFVHVADVVSAIMLALDDTSMTGAWNVGTGVATSVNDLAALMIEASGEHAMIERQPARGEVMRSCIDPSKLRATGRWAPRRSLASALPALLRPVARAD
jgi:UDP-glucose 4-epimerase